MRPLGNPGNRFSLLRSGRTLKAAIAFGIGISAVALMAQYNGSVAVDPWWEAGTGRSLPMWTVFPDSTGELMVLNGDGPVATQNHPFFESLGTNGRACVTCHQPSAAMSLSTDQIADRWKETSGKDPVFAAIDGSNCPILAQDKKSSHSLLLERGVFRIYQPWPAAGLKPEFTVEVVHDPTGCNTDSSYGLHSPQPTISVFRRPRVLGNLKFVLGSEQAFNLDARSLVPVAAHLSADGRDPSLERQATEAAIAHEQAMHPLTPAQLQKILDFERQIYVAQTTDDAGGSLAETDGPLGAWNLGRVKPVSMAEQTTSPTPIFFNHAYWFAAAEKGSPTQAFRDSVARGNAIFTGRAFSFADAANSHASSGTCATCHNAPLAGSNFAQQAMDVGTTNVAGPLDAAARDLPLFKVTCNKDATPHPTLGRIIYTTDPGRALITGKCSDVGSIVAQQFRALAARAPYFSNGSAQTLRDVVDYYDTRFDIRLTETDKHDLVNFLSVL